MFLRAALPVLYSSKPSLKSSTFFRKFCAVSQLKLAEIHHIKDEEQLNQTYGKGIPRQELCSLVFSCPHTPGSLQKVITLFEEHDINMRRIESKPSKNAEQFDILVDLEASPNDARVARLLTGSTEQPAVQLMLSKPKPVPWFPQHISDLDTFSTHTLNAGEDLESDHPGFRDEIYRERRKSIVANAGVYKYGDEIPRVQYSTAEVETWGKVYRKLTSLYPKYGCKEFNKIFPLMEANCGYAENNIPQLEDISNYLQEKTGFRLRPVAGLLTARDFLNSLAFRTFFSTQYIRHSSRPFYTPEPDICHELMGHVPMFADPNFADFSQAIGLASLGASDTDIKRLATCYWFSVEFGLTKELSQGAVGALDSEVKAYGAGLLSSFGELEYACQKQDGNETQAEDGEKGFSGKPTLLKWEPAVSAETEYPITTYQPVYFVAESLADAKDKMIQFCDHEISRPFYVQFDPETCSVIVDRNVSPVIRKAEEIDASNL